MEFLIGSTLPVKSYKIVSLSYTSRAIHCALYLPLELYITIINAKPVHLIISYVKQEIDFQLGIKLAVK